MREGTSAMANPDRNASTFQPVRMFEVELSQPLPVLATRDSRTGRHYRRAQVLVRLHAYPLGVIELCLGEHGLGADQYAPLIWRAFNGAINDHLAQDALPEVGELEPSGLTSGSIPACVKKREQLLKDSPFISVVVCTRDRPTQLANCLLSLMKSDYPNYEVIVVDNAPLTSTTADLVRTLYGHLPHVHYALEVRPGLSWARNRGLQQARGEIVAFTDDDVQVDRYWLVELVRAFQVAENVACVTGATLPAEIETEPQVWFEQFAGFNKGRDFSRLILNMTTHRLSDPLYPYLAPKFGAGVNMAFKASALRDLGGFDPALGMTGEDIDMFFRVITEGYTLIYEPAALIRHFDRRNYADLYDQLHRFGVSFTAFLTKCLVVDPKRIFFLVSKLPHALVYLLSPRSARNKLKQPSYPKELTRRELRGMLYGPLAYLRHRWHLRKTIKHFGPLEAAFPFQPVRLLEVELSQPLPDISACDERTERHYQRARVLVRLHTQPLGLVDLTLEAEGVSADTFAGHIWRALHQAINDHLRQDGLPEVTELSTAGLLCPDTPRCLQERARFLAEAPFASVIVCTRDRTEQLATCLPSLLALQYPHYEIIVVDNAPRTSATADLFRERYGDLPQVRYVREDRPGLSWARNCGLRHARGEIVAYTDDDIQADPYWLAELARGFKIADNVACITGFVLPAELETRAQIWFEEFGGFYKGRGFTELIFNMTTHRLQHPLYPYLASIFGAGANIAFKTAVLRALGGFDPALGVGTPTSASEEIDVFFQLIMKGYTLVSEPAALVRHFHRRDYAGLCNQLNGYGTGFTAYLTKCLVADPRRGLYLLSKLPYAVHYLLSPRSARNEHKQSSYPHELTRTELRGMLYGPIAYLRSCWHVRKITKKLEPLKTDQNTSSKTSFKNWLW